MLLPIMMTAACAGPLVGDFIGHSESRYEEKRYNIPLTSKSQSSQYYSDKTRLRRPKCDPIVAPSDDDLMWADVCALRKAYELRCHVMNHTIVDSIFTVWSQSKAWRLNCRNEDDPECPERYIA